MNFNQIKLKKIIGFILILSFLAPSFFLSAPNKVSAMTVTDPANTAMNAVGNTSAAISAVSDTETAIVENSMWVKEYILDPIAYMAAKIALQMMSKSIVNWIQGGFDGSPAFITDFEGFLREIADATIGEYIYGSKLQFLCGPFSLDVKIALLFAFSKPYTPKCTLSDVVGNIENAIDDLEHDWKWGTWISMTSSENNNAYGSFIKAHAAMVGDIQDKKTREKTKLDWGSGFLSWETDNYVDADGVILDEDDISDELNLEPDADGNYVDSDGGIFDAEDMTSEMAEQGEVTKRIATPGSVLMEGLTGTMELGPLALVAADEINEIVGALLQQLMMKVIGPEGLLGQDMRKYKSSAEFHNLKKQIITAVSSALDPEKEYNKVKTDSLNAVLKTEQTFLDVITCWESKTWLNASTTQYYIDIAFSTIATEITPLKTDLTKDVESSQNNIDNLKNINTQNNNADTVSDLDKLMDAFQDIQNAGTLHGQGAVIEAKVERDGYGVDISGLDIGVLKKMKELNNKVAEDQDRGDFILYADEEDKGGRQRLGECQAVQLPGNTDPEDYTVSHGKLIYVGR